MQGIEEDRRVRKDLASLNILLILLLQCLQLWPYPLCLLRTPNLHLHNIVLGPSSFLQLASYYLCPGCSMLIYSQSDEHMYPQPWQPISMRVTRRVEIIIISLFYMEANPYRAHTILSEAVVGVLGEGVTFQATGRAGRVVIYQSQPLIPPVIYPLGLNYLGIMPDSKLVSPCLLACFQAVFPSAPMTACGCMLKECKVERLPTQNGNAGRKLDGEKGDYTKSFDSFLSARNDLGPSIKSPNSNCTLYAKSCFGS